MVLQIIYDYDFEAAVKEHEIDLDEIKRLCSNK